MSATLAQRQRTLLQLVKGRAGEGADAALAGSLRGSPYIELLREVMLRWRRLELERYCRFTVALLQRRGDFGPVLEGFVRSGAGSQFIEEQAELFLNHVAADPDALIAAMAVTENALFRSRREPAFAAVIPWSHDPAAVFAFVLHGLAFDEAAIRGAFEVRIGFQVPGGLEWGVP